MARCPNCNSDLPPFAIQCAECGTSFSTDTVQEGAVPERATRPIGQRPFTLAGTPGLGTSTIPDGANSGDPDLMPTREQAQVSRPPQVVGLTDATLQLDTDGKGARLKPPTSEVPASAPPIPKRIRLPMVGDVVEGYRIEQEVGRGGMGRVYRSVHAVTGQEVALKMLLPEMIGDPRLKARFVNEAKVLARLKHPNLVPLLGFLDTGGRAFIVMPFVRGITLERMLAHQGRLSFKVAIDLFRQIANALEEVHRHDVMHRDLKPANVIIDGDGQAFVTDFGIARAIGSQKLTMTGMVVGTAEYLSPEQASGEARDDLRSDVYALGVLFYHMVCGQVPFRHPSAAQVLLKHVSSPPPPPTTIRPDLPMAAESVLLKALEKEPARRYPNVAAFRDALVAAFEPKPRPSGLPPAAVDRTPKPAKIPPPTRAAAPAPRPRPRPPRRAAKTHWGLRLTQWVVGLLLGALLGLVTWGFLEP